MILIFITCFIIGFPIYGCWYQWRKSKRLQKLLDKVSPLLNSIDEKDKKIEFLNKQLEQYQMNEVNNRKNQAYHPMNDKTTNVPANEIKPYNKTSYNSKYTIKEIQEGKDYFVGWTQEGTIHKLILKKRTRGYVDYEPVCTFVNKGWKSPELIKENAQCCTLRIGDAYVYMYSPAKGIVYYSEKSQLCNNDTILYIETNIEKISSFEKETIKQTLLEKQQKKQLEKLATQELIDEGTLFPEANKRPPIPKEVVDTVWNRDAGKCVYCGSTENIHLDHIIPFSKGGATNVENLQLLCQKCNLEKSNKIG